MNEQVSKKRILELIQSERTALQATLEGMSEAQMTEPGVESDWSVKDILVHIAAWEGMMVRWVEETLRGEIPERPAPGMTWDDLDDLNAQIYADNKDRALDEVLEEFQASHQRAVETVQAMTEEELLDPGRFEWRQGDPMWHMVAANTCWHYKEHRETIGSWLAEKRW
jgi:hypothetical protein